MRKIIKLMAICLFFLALSSASYAQIFREKGNVGIVLHETNWKVMSETSDDFTKYINFSFEKLSDTEYVVYWKWNDLDVMKKVNECANYQITGKGDIGKCLIELNDTTLTSDKEFTTNLEKISTTPIETLTADTKLTENSIDLAKPSGTFKIDLLSKEAIGEIIKIGFKSTIIELTDVNAEIIIDPEIESCRDGLCIHNIQINNNTDSNFCFNSFDIYGSSDPKVSNKKMYFYKKYSDENGEWYAWDELTTQVCTEPHTTGQLKYYYNVPQFSSGKWNFHFWYNETDYEIDPYYNNYGWTFTLPSNYDFNALAISVDGNAYLNTTGGAAYTQWHLNEASGTNVSDSSGNDRNCTLTNMEDGDWVAGKINNALQFDGTNEYAACGDIADFERTTPVSYEFWFSTTLSTMRMVISKYNAVLDKGLMIYLNSGSIWFDLRSGSSAYLAVSTVKTVNDGLWHHAIITYNGNTHPSGVKIYVDSNSENLNNNKDTLASSTLNSGVFYIGRRPAGSYWSGKIDELVIYEHELSQSEVNARYNSGVGTETIAGTSYPTQNPIITPKYALTDENTITQLNSFIETASKPSGTEIKYQLTDDNGSTFKWWDGGTWATATDSYSQANTASEINTNITSFSVSAPREIKFRAYLHSDGNSIPKLDNIDINYTYILSVNNPPSIPILNPQLDNTNTTRNFSWQASTDTELDTIRYHINIGTCSGCNNELDANTFDINYNNVTLTAGKTYYWSVRACDNNYSDNYNNCSDWSSEDVFSVFVINNPPSIPILISQPDNSQTIRSFDWNASIDGEGDTIRYHIKVGTNYGGAEKLDANVFDTNYNDLNLGGNGVYYWSVRACDNNYGTWKNCSNWATDTFQVFSAGGVNIIATILNTAPQIKDFLIYPQFWHGDDANVMLNYRCYDPNGLVDLDKTWARITGGIGDADFNIDFNMDAQGKVSENIALYFSQRGNYKIMAFCQDDNSNISTDEWHNFYYTSDFNILINNGDANTMSLLVDLYLQGDTAWWMAFSCDDNHWTDWIIYDDFYPDWDLTSGNYGCLAHGEGIYTVYALFLDGVDNMYANYDAIYVKGEAISLAPYTNPDDPPTLTSYFALAPPEIAWGLLAVVGLVCVGGFFAIRRRGATI